MIFSSIPKRVLYSLYLRRLQTQVRERPLPKHIAVILDGNRRYAKQQGLWPPSKGHHLGAEKLDDLLEWCDELTIPVVTVWALSADNFRRDAAEMDELADVIQRKLGTLADARPRRRLPRSIHGVGRLDLLPASMKNAISDAEARTVEAGPLRLNIALGYDGQEEIVQAVRNFLLERADEEMSLRDAAEEITPEGIASWLYCKGAPDPDLIIRTSGELRLSGFLLWQSAYSELYFCDTLWPAFRKVDFFRALRSYQQRGRRYGR